jgi:hypothetical protein
MEWSITMRTDTLMWAALFAFGILLAGAVNAHQARQDTAKTGPHAKDVKRVLEPKAMDILKAMGERLAAARTMMFTAFESFESPNGQDHPLVYTAKSELTLQRPDRLRLLLSGDGPSAEFHYDGKKMTASSPVENLLAVADAPPTIDAALKAAYHAAGIYFPFADLSVADPSADAAPGIQLAYYVGQSSQVADTKTDIVAYAGDGVFAQMWIGAEDKLPRLIHAVYLDDPLQLRHDLFLSNWHLDLAIRSDAFDSCIPFAHLEPQTPAGVTPNGIVEPSKLL